MRIRKLSSVPICERCCVARTDRNSLASSPFVAALWARSETKNGVLPYGAGEITLEDGALLQGAVKVGTNMTVNGAIDAGNSNIVLDLTKRTPEDGIMISDISSFAPNSWTVELAQYPATGVYVLGGNAADFAGTITVRSQSGQTFGSLSLADSTFSYDTVSYTLGAAPAIVTVDFMTNCVTVVSEDPFVGVIVPTRVQTPLFCEEA